MEEKVEFRDLAESSESLDKGVFVDAWMEVADVESSRVFAGAAGCVWRVGGGGSGSGS